MPTKTTTSNRRRKATAPAPPRQRRASTPPAPTAPDTTDKPAATDLPVRPEADPVLADAADRAADLAEGLREQAAADAQRILTAGQARAEQLLETARGEADALTSAAAADRDRILADARRSAEQASEQAAATAAASVDRALADARTRADTITANARAAADQIVAGAQREAGQVAAKAAAQADQALTDARRQAQQIHARATAEADQVLEQARTAAADVRSAADRTRAAADAHAAQVRSAAEQAATGLRRDADRALADARADAGNVRTVAERDVARLREQAAEDARTAREAAAAAAADRAAAAADRAEAERILAAASEKTVQRAKRREIRRKARQDAAAGTGVPALSGRELLGALAVVVAAATVSTLGLLSSYTALETAARGWGWSWPWLLPVGIDVSIPAFTGAGLLLIRMAMELRWVRWVPRILTGATVYLNWSASHSLAGRIGHAALTLLWVVFSEIASHIYATRIGAVTGKTRMESIRRSRWVLAPVSTARLRRRMILWEITSYDEGLTRLQERTVLRAQLREKYGWDWRRKAPLELRMALRLGSAPAALADTLTPAASDTNSADDTSALTIERADTSAPDAHGDASASAPALNLGRAHGERERKALTSGAHHSERASASASGDRADSGRSRSEAQALTERRVTAIRVLAAKLGRRPTSAEIVSALVDAGLAEPDMSRPTAQRLRAHAETNAA